MLDDRRRSFIFSKSTSNCNISETAGWSFLIKLCIYSVVILSWLKICTMEQLSNHSVFKMLHSPFYLFGLRFRKLTIIVFAKQHTTLVRSISDVTTTFIVRTQIVSSISYITLFCGLQCVCVKSYFWIESETKVVGHLSFFKISSKTRVYKKHQVKVIFASKTWSFLGNSRFMI